MTNRGGKVGKKLTRQAGGGVLTEPQPPLRHRLRSPPASPDKKMADGKDFLEGFRPTVVFPLRGTTV